MKRWRFLVLIATMLLAALAMPRATRAVETRELRFKGHIVEAYFSFENGCTVSNLNVQAAEGTFDDGAGGPATLAKAHISLFQLNICNEPPTQVLSAGATVTFDDQAFEADNQLNTASLDLTTQICGDTPDSCFEVSVDLRWAGTRDITDHLGQFRSKSPTCSTQVHSNESERMAAVSGSISSDVLSDDRAVTLLGRLAVVRDRHMVSRGEGCHSDGGGGAFPI